MRSLGLIVVAGAVVCTNAQEQPPARFGVAVEGVQVDVEGGEGAIPRLRDAVATRGFALPSAAGLESSVARHSTCMRPGSVRVRL